MVTDAETGRQARSPTTVMRLLADGQDLAALRVLETLDRDARLALAEAHVDCLTRLGEEARALEVALEALESGSGGPELRRRAEQLARSLGRVPQSPMASARANADPPALRPPSLREWLVRRPWTRCALSPEVVRAPTMLSMRERALLTFLAREHVQGRGQIVDAGAFLGGSTLALATGLAANERRAGVRIHSYDLFRIDKWALASYTETVGDRPLGASSRDCFEAVLGEHLELVDVYEGDVLDQRWPGVPIEVLFIDIAKSWAINDHVTREFFPSLVAGESVVIQQDYVHEWLPWLHITMGLLDDAFELVATMPYGSAVFVVTRDISADEVPESLFEDISHDDKLALFDRVVRRHAGWERGVLECARAALLADIGRGEEATAHLDETLSRYAECDQVQTAAKSLRDGGRVA